MLGFGNQSSRTTLSWTLIGSLLLGVTSHSGYIDHGRTGRRGTSVGYADQDTVARLGGTRTHHCLGIDVPDTSTGHYGITRLYHQNVGPGGRKVFHHPDASSKKYPRPGGRTDGTGRTDLCQCGGGLDTEMAGQEWTIPTTHAGTREHRIERRGGTGRRGHGNGRR